MGDRNSLHLRNLLFILACGLGMWLVLRYEPAPATPAGEPGLDWEAELPPPTNDAETDVARWKRLALEAPMGWPNDPEVEEIEQRIVRGGAGSYDAILRYLPTRVRRVAAGLDGLLTQAYRHANEAGEFAPISQRIARCLDGPPEADERYLSLSVLGEPVGGDFAATATFVRYWQTPTDAHGRPRPLYLRALALRWLLQHRRIDQTGAAGQLRDVLAREQIDRRDADELAEAALAAAYGGALLEEMCRSGQAEAVLSGGEALAGRLHQAEGLPWLASLLSADVPEPIRRRALTELHLLAGERFDPLPETADGLRALRERWQGWLRTNGDRLEWDQGAGPTGLFIVSQ